MAAELDKIHHTLRGFAPPGLGEYPDKIGGYHGCLTWRRSSSLKLQGNWLKLSAVPVAIDKAMAENMTGPQDSQGGRR
jgi:hypothetical protein